MSIQTLIEHGPFIAGAAEPLSGEHARSSTRARASSSGASPSATARGRRPRGACRARGAARVGPARLRRPRQGHPRVRGGLRGARRRAYADPRRRAGQDDPRGQDRAAQGRRHARALRRAVAPGARDQRPQRRPRRRRRACCAARSASSPRSCRGTSRRRCCATSSARRSWPATRSWPSPRTRRRSRRCGWPRSSTRPGCRRACSTCCPARGSVVGEALVAPPARAQGRLHRLDADRRAGRRARRGRLQARDARARRLRPDDHLRRRRPRRPPPAPPPWAASTTAARRAWRSSACTSSSRSPTRSSRRSRPRPSGCGSASAATPTASSARCTPRASASELERQIAECGGEIVAGGGRPEGLDTGWFHEPTVVVEPGRDSPMAREEVFGPALPIWRVKDLDEAIELANDSPFGLGSSRVDARPGHAPSAPPPSSTAATRGSTRARRSTTSCRSAA